MKTSFSIFILAILTTSIVFSGCQSTDEQSGQMNSTDQTSQQEIVVDKGVPFSNGPDEGPESMVGPNSPPPASTSTLAAPAQAVTTDENIRITLPRKTE